MRRRRWTRIAAIVVLGAVAGGTAAAQDNGAAQFRLGTFFPSGGGEFFEENEDVFTFDASDLNGWSFGFTYVIPMSPRIELGLNLDYGEGTDVTQYRDVVDEDGFPTLHDTRLRVAPASVDVRFLPGGRSARRGAHGQYAAKKPIFYVGAGLGANLFVGRHGNGSADLDFGGMIDELRIFEGNLSPQQIQNLYQYNAVPEPSTFAMAAAAGLALLALRRRTRAA